MFGETPTAWLYILPAVVIILGLAIVPVVWSLLLCVQDKDPIAETTSCVGLDNYRTLLDDPEFARRGPPHADLHGAVRAR